MKKQTLIALLIFALLAFPSCSNGSSSSESDSAPEPTSQAHTFTVTGTCQLADGVEWPETGSSTFRVIRASDGYRLPLDSVFNSTQFRDFSVSGIGIMEFEFNGLTEGTWEITFERLGQNGYLIASQTITISASSPNTTEIALYLAPPQAAR